MSPVVSVGRRIWFERKFELGLPLDSFPEILERVRGTPARLEERVRGLAPEILTRRAGTAWSIQENVGHLWDLEPLWYSRLEEFLRGGDHLPKADLKNTKTHEAGHNEAKLQALLAGFREARFRTVERLEGLGAAELGRIALHPRLQQPMTIVDHFYFVAEHDDHHLATMGALMRAFEKP